MVYPELVGIKWDTALEQKSFDFVRRTTSLSLIPSDVPFPFQLRKDHIHLSIVIV